MANAHIENLRIPPLVEPFDLRLADGEAVAILGPSQSGKTRLLRAIAGLDPCPEGRILIGDGAVEGLPAAQRGISMVFSKFALYPHLDVEGNLDFPMESLGLTASERRDRVDDLATQLDLVSLLDRMPAELSTAQRVRAAIARALARAPQLLLIDDCLSTLSARERQATRVLLRRIQRSMRLATIYATEDFADAMSLGDRIAFIAAGRLQQADTPAHLYDNPATSAVAAALGAPPINLLDGVYERGTLRLADQEISLPGPSEALSAAHGPVVVGIRPEMFDVAGDRKNSILAILDPSSRQSMGSFSIVSGQVGEKTVFVQVPGNPTVFPRRAYAPPTDVLLFDRETGRRLR